jgi:hypothetical protein
MEATNPKANPVDPQSVIASFSDHYTKSSADFEALVSPVDAEFVFQTIVTQFLLARSTVDEAGSSQRTPAHVELAAYFLYPRFGIGGKRDPELIQRIFDGLEDLNLSRGLAVAAEIQESDPELSTLRCHLLLQAELVRGSTYAPLLRKRIEGMQCPHDAWFAKMLGIGPIRALQIADAYLIVLNENLTAERAKLFAIFAKAGLPNPTTGIPSPKTMTGEEIAQLKQNFGGELESFFDNAPVNLAPSFDQIKSKVLALTKAEWEALRNLIGLTPDSRKAISDPRDIRDRPIYWLPGDRILYLDVSCVFDALFDFYDDITKQPANLGFRDRQYVPSFSNWMEKEVPSYWQRVFPPRCIFSNLTYPDPDKSGGEAELDTAISWGPFLIMCEIKGKQYRKRSRLGDIPRLRDDLKASIEDAFSQASRATRYITANAVSVFKEKHTGRELRINKDQMRSIFPVSITLQEFGGLATQLALLRKIGLFKNSAYPWSLSLANLDVITRFIESPDVFLHYIKRRIDLQNSGKNIQGDELDVFGHYLDSRLHPSHFWKRKTPNGKDFTFMQLTGGSDDFDEWFLVEIANSGQKPEIALKLPSGIRKLLDGLRKRDDNETRWIAFALLDLSPSTLDRIEDNLESLLANVKENGAVVRSTTVEDDTVVSIIVSRGILPEYLEQHTVRRAKIEKYRHKATLSISFGIDISQGTRPFEIACYEEGPWSFDQGIENLIKNEVPKMLPGQKLPGRNDRCICGSGKKFKHCCIDKIKEWRPSAPNL